jgi:tetratricopeptide (TPR) repeat protein
MLKTFACLLLVVGCGGGAAEGTKGTGGGGGGGGSKPSAAGDVSFEVPVIKIEGVMFEPEALGRPGMPLVDAKNKVTIEKQRTIVTNTKDPVLRQAQAAILATLLYRKSKDAKGDDQDALLKEARQTLRDAATAAGDKNVDEITLRLLGSYELILGDFAAAEKAWGTLVEKAPKDKDALFNRAWWAYSLLQEHKNAEALAAVKDTPLTEKQPELAYVTAWAKWRTGDNTGAWQAILTAAKGWGGNALKDAVDRDVLLFAGRTGTTFDDALKQMLPLYATAAGQQKAVQTYEVLAKLGLQSYQFAGRWNDGVAAIEKALTTIGKDVPVNDKPVLRYTEADYTVRLDDPVKAAGYAKEALEALPTCGQKCSDKDKENVVESVYIMGRLFHILYATAHDDRYYQPAHDLYAASIPLITMNDKVREQANKDAGYLEGSFKSMKAAAGTHDKDSIGALLGRHNQEVQACYEQGLAANPKLGGTLVVNLESDQSGAIKGVATEPKAGVAEMAMVAGCVTGRAKGWTLPKRANGNGPAGVTRIKLSYSMGPAPAPTPKQAPPPPPAKK